MKSTTAHNVDVIIPAMGVPSVSPYSIAMDHTGGTVCWFVYNAHPVICSVCIVFDNQGAITFLDGEDTMTMAEQTVPESPFNQQGSNCATIPANNGTAPIVYKYTVIFKDCNGNEVMRIDPYIVVDSP